MFNNLLYQLYISMITKKGMESDIQLLELASGIKDSLIKAGFTTISFILSSTITDISNKLGIDPYVARIIFEEAKKIRDAAPAATSTAAINKDNNYNNTNYLLSINEENIIA
jgi:hypothetical protein